MCKKCRVYANFTEKNGWYCDFCNTTENDIGYFRLSDNELRPTEDELDGNYRFYKFFKDGKE